MGGRGSVSRITGSSGGRGGGGFGVSGGSNVSPAPIQMQTSPPQIVPTAQQAQNANAGTFSATDTQGFHDLYNGRQYFQQQNLSIDSQVAVINYLSDQPEPGSRYSMAQNMNAAMANGQRLTANQQFTHDNMMAAMHNLGYNLNLTRYDHAPTLNNLLAQYGVRGANYEHMTAAQLKSALVGRTYSENKFLSTSYNDFRNAPPGNPFTDRAVKFVYRAKASVQAMMPGNGPGGRLGEIVLAPNTPMKIVDVDFTGQSARHKGTQSHTAKQVVVTVEVG